MIDNASTVLALGLNRKVAQLGTEEHLGWFTVRLVLLVT